MTATNARPGNRLLNETGRIITSIQSRCVVTRNGRGECDHFDGLKAENVTVLEDSPERLRFRVTYEDGQAFAGVSDEAQSTIDEFDRKHDESPNSSPLYDHHAARVAMFEKVGLG